MQNFVSKLKSHLLPRVKTALLEEGAQSSMDTEVSPAAVDQAQDRLFILSDRIYKHHLLRINYTTYDVRRSQDIINPGTSHRDIMSLASNPDDDSDTEGSSPEHPFIYARVLGIYHVNVAYAGMGMHDYVTRRLDFVWVRWYDYVGTESLHWSDRRLDSVRFPPMASEHAFGFLDPRDILRGCHVVPAFVDGKLHCDSISMSQFAQDVHDFKRYCINRLVSLVLSSSHIDIPISRFVDRDMVMRYHWGLAVGHLYTHNRPLRTSNNSTHSSLPNADSDNNSDDSEGQGHDKDSMLRAHDSDESESETGSVLQTGEHEFLVNVRDDDNWDSDDDPVNEDSESFADDGEDSDIEMLASMDE